MITSVFKCTTPHAALCVVDPSAYLWTFQFHLQWWWTISLSLSDGPKGHWRFPHSEDQINEIDCFLINDDNIWGWHHNLFVLQTLKTWISRLKLKDRKADIITCKYILLLLVKQLCLLKAKQISLFSLCFFNSKRNWFPWSSSGCLHIWIRDESISHR